MSYLNRRLWVRVQRLVYPGRLLSKEAPFPAGECGPKRKRASWRYHQLERASWLYHQLANDRELHDKFFDIRKPHFRLRFTRFGRLELWRVESNGKSSGWNLTPRMAILEGTHPAWWRSL